MGNTPPNDPSPHTHWNSIRNRNGFWARAASKRHRPERVNGHTINQRFPKRATHQTVVGCINPGSRVTRHTPINAGMWGNVFWENKKKMYISVGVFRKFLICDMDMLVFFVSSAADFWMMFEFWVFFFFEDLNVNNIKIVYFFMVFNIIKRLNQYFPIFFVPCPALTF